jgi:purine nucleosidase
MAPRKIIIDCDPGHDDAVAILLAAGDPDVEIVGITTVAGNQTLDRVTANACTAATVAGLDVAVHAGCDRPLVRALRTAAEFHGVSGLDGPAPIVPAVHRRQGHAVDFITRTVMADPGNVTIVALGPLTNLATALLRCPEMAGAAAGVSLMGGSYTRGNITPAAEFNIYVDPEAAAAVFEAGWDVTMVGLDVTHQALYTSDVEARFRRLGTPAAHWVMDLMGFFAVSYREAAGMSSPPVHDPCAVAALFDPAVLTLQAASVVVETTGTSTSGMTVVDFAAPTNPRHRVAVGIDVEAFWTRVVNAVGALAPADLVAADLVAADLVAADLVAADPAAVDLAAADPAAAEPAAADPASPG